MEEETCFDRRNSHLGKLCLVYFSPQGRFLGTGSENTYFTFRKTATCADCKTQIILPAASSSSAPAQTDLRGPVGEQEPPNGGSLRLSRASSTRRVLLGTRKGRTVLMRMELVAVLKRGVQQVTGHGGLLGLLRVFFR